MKNVGLVSALVFTGISVVIAVVFLLATLSGSFTIIERIGGAVWVFILSMIILMPIVIPRVKKKMTQTSRRE